MLHIRTLRVLKIGEFYNIYFNSIFKTKCKFIQVTPKGYNFLNLETNKCVFLKRHFYVYKKNNEKNILRFWINKDLKIEHI